MVRGRCFKDQKNFPWPVTLKSKPIEVTENPDFLEIVAT